MSDMRARNHSREALAWLLGLACVAAVLSAVDYETRDPDSALYASMAADLVHLPVARWIAPEWNGHWNLHGLFFEHPAGILFLPALVGRLGLSATWAAYVVNCVFEVATVVAVGWLAGLFLPAQVSRRLSWLILLLPIAFTYRVRANHEQLVLLAVVVALFSAERARASAAWLVGVVLATASLAMVKGVFAVFVPALLAVYASLRIGGDRGRDGATRLVAAIVLAVATIAVVAWGYDAWFKSQTGASFVGQYLARQFGVAAEMDSGKPATGKLWNVAWYLGRIAWFTFPWGALGVWVAGRRLTAGAGARRALRPTPDGGRRGRSIGLFLCIGAVLTYLIVFGFFARRADRYIFPAYFFAAAPGIVWWLESRAIGRSLAERFSERFFPYERAMLWTALTLVAVLTSFAHLPNIKLVP